MKRVVLENKKESAGRQEVTPTSAPSGTARASPRRRTPSATRGRTAAVQLCCYRRTCSSSLKMTSRAVTGIVTEKELSRRGSLPKAPNQPSERAGIQTSKTLKFTLLTVRRSASQERRTIYLHACACACAREGRETEGKHVIHIAFTQKYRHN